MIELLMHLNFPSGPILQKSINIPCVMPHMTATLLLQTYSDQLMVIPENMTNLSVIGQFVEIPDESTVSMDYSVRGAQQAVMQLMGLHIELKKTRKSSIITPESTLQLPLHFLFFYSVLDLFYLAEISF